MKKLFYFLIFMIPFQVLNAQTVPEKPSLPYGISSLCNYNVDANYTIPSIINADNYIWSLIPQEAGVLSGGDTSIVINFSESYSGIAKLSVVATNSFGESPSSDSLNIFIDKLIEKPQIPFGDSIVCQGNSELTYAIDSIDGVSDYIWAINPLESSIISNGDSSAILKIYPEYVGDISISIAVQNTCGTSNNSEPKIVHVIQAPLAPGIPIGEDIYCLNDSSHKFYTNGTTFATDYEWKILPDSAATLETKTDTVFAHWNKNFRKDFQVFVKAKNICGMSEFSQPFESYVLISPSIPKTISGDSSICSGTDYTTFSVDSIDEAKEYSWTIIPDTAGEISGITNRANVYWDKNYLGDAQIAVKAINECGISEYSEYFTANVEPFPEKMDKPSGVDEMCINAQDLSYESSPSKYSKSYDWIIIPNNAGVIEKDSIIGIMNWNDNYIGNVRLAVRGVNACGKGPSSDTLLIVIKEQLYSQFNFHVNSLNVAFTNESFPELKQNTYLWNFGDGNSSNDINPDHNYNQPGQFTVSLKIDNPYCEESISEQSIELSANSIYNLAGNFDKYFSIHPNPVENTLLINKLNTDNSVFNIRIVDLQGRTFLNKKTQFNSINYSLELNSLKSGLYYLVLYSENTIFVKKFVKK